VSSFAWKDFGKPRKSLIIAADIRIDNQIFDFPRKKLRLRPLAIG
jgi:hypothetical protein